MFTQNIIFFDGEFTRLKTDGINFLSLAFVKPTGESLYIELDQPESECDSWVVDNVIPYLNGDKTSQEKAVKMISDFVGNSKPTLIADVNQFDWMGICGLFGVWDIPFFYIPIDFSTILNVKGIDPDINRMELANSYGINTAGFKQHNALSDALVLKALYEKLV